MGAQVKRSVVFFKTKVAKTSFFAMTTVTALIAATAALTVTVRQNQIAQKITPEITDQIITHVHHPVTSRAPTSRRSQPSVTERLPLNEVAHFRGSSAVSSAYLSDDATIQGVELPRGAYLEFDEDSQQLAAAYFSDEIEVQNLQINRSIHFDRDGQIAKVFLSRSQFVGDQFAPEGSEIMFGPHGEASIRHYAFDEADEAVAEIEEES